MIVLGLSGAFNLPEQTYIPNLPTWFFHDAAAAVVRDGEVLAAVEEERVSRIKHTNLFPLGAAKAALRTVNIRPADIDAFAYYFREDYINGELGLQCLSNRNVPLCDARGLIVERLSTGFGIDVSAKALCFVDHHKAHAHLTYHHAGFREALVGVFDGNGEEHSITIFAAKDGGMKRLKTEPPEKSFGHLYSIAIELLGYGGFDEYKVMGLAPYGDPNRFRSLFLDLIDFRPEGQYRLDVGRVRLHFLRSGILPRRRGVPLEQIHADFAAALQESLETLVIHLLKYWRDRTGLHSLCLAGGVAQNCSMNGQIARSGLFKRIFVHPAAHDAGAAVGAALIVSTKHAGRVSSQPIKHVAWGMPIDAGEVESLLARWSDFFEVVTTSDITSTAAQLLATGQIIGWARGRMEFGPRALGQRSILADPRPSANRERINSIIKKREAYRPFAPMVLAAECEKWFELSATSCNLDFMIFTVPVKSQYRKLLGAVTHVDGSARVQVVSPDVLPDTAELLEKFARITGIPILLNTSFNIDAEPIVGTAGEALLCFIGTELDALVLGDRVIKRRSFPDSFWLDLILVPRKDIAIRQQKLLGRNEDSLSEIAFTHPEGRCLEIPRIFANLLERVDGYRTLKECGLDDLGISEDVAIDLIKKIIAHRFFRIKELDAF